MTWILRLLLLVALFYLGRALLSQLFGQGTGRQKKGGRRASFSRDQMRSVSGLTVKDPQCGTYVAESIALPGTVRGETYFFCSEKCREEFEASPGRRSEGEPTPSS